MKTLNHITGLSLISLSVFGLAALTNAILEDQQSLWMIPMFIAFVIAILYGDKLLKKTTFKTE